MIPNTTKIKRGNTFFYEGKQIWCYRMKTRDIICACSQPDFDSATIDDFFDVSIDDLKPIKSQHAAINKVSEGKKQDDKIYNTLRKVFLENHSECELRLKGCTRKATEVHHLYSGASRSKYYLVVSEWKSACRNCHDKVHTFLSKDEAMELGLKKME